MQKKNNNLVGKFKPHWFDIFKKIIYLSEKEVLWMMVSAVFLGIIYFILEYLFLYSLQGFLIAIKITDTRLLKMPGWYPRGEVFAFIMLVCVGVVRTVVVALKSFLGGVANQSFIRIHRSRIFEYSVIEATKTSSHKVSSLFTEVISRAGDSVVAMISITVSLTSTFFLFASGLKMAPQEMAMGVVLISVMLLPVKFFDKAINESGKGLTLAWNKVNKLLLEGMRHNLFFKSHGLEDDHIKRGLDEINTYENFFKRYFLFGAVKNGLPSLVGIFTLGVISFVSRKYLTTSSESLFAFLYIFMRFAQGGAEIIAFGTQFRLNVSSIDTLYDWTQNKYLNVIEYKNNRPKMLNRINWTQDLNLKVENINFSYNEKVILKNISLNLHQQDRLIVVGDSGAGKSTFLSIILGVNKPTSGLIEFNNTAINEILPEFRNNLSYVAPEPFLFEGSIRENLLYGHPNAIAIQDEIIWKVLDNVLVGDYVKARAGGLDSRFEEHAEASTGQKQRLALARALIRNPKILVLDEATSNLDIETERIVLDHVFREMENSIVIFVSHRPALERYSNKVLRLE